MEKIVALDEGALAATMALLICLRASEITNRIIRDLDQSRRRPAHHERQDA
jgi:hypothetical protein